jgi:hypothetical protein
MTTFCARLVIFALAANVHAQSPAQWRLIEEWRVGGAAEGPHFLLDVRAIATLPDGNLAVVEGRDQQVHILGPRGQAVKTVGRRGAGPGEFRGANGALVTPAGEIVVSDAVNARLTFVALNGDVLRTIPHAPSGNATRWTAWFGTDGRLVEVGSAVAPGPNGEPVATEIHRKWSADYLRADTVRSLTCAQYPAAPPEFIGYRTPSPSGRGFQTLTYPFGMPPHRAQMYDQKGGFWVSSFPEYRAITKLTFGTCAAVTTVELSGQPTPVPTATREAIQAGLRERASAAPGQPMGPDPERVRRALAYFEGMTSDATGQLWVERLVPGTAKFSDFGVTGDRRFEIFSAQGKLVAETAIPEKMCAPRCGRPMAITATHVYAIVVDADDVPYLAAFRIARN